MNNLEAIMARFAAAEEIIKALEDAQKPQDAPKKITIAEVLQDYECGIIDISARVRCLLHWEYEKDVPLEAVRGKGVRNFGKKSQTELSELKDYYRRKGIL